MGKTQRLALPLAAAFGIVVAALGVRALGQFINVEPDAMGGAQHSWFTTVETASPAPSSPAAATPSTGS